MNELKPCWCCKSPVKFQKENRYLSHYVLWIECSACCMGTYPVICLKSQSDLCDKDLMDEWNKGIVYINFKENVTKNIYTQWDEVIGFSDGSGFRPLGDFDIEELNKLNRLIEQQIISLENN